MPGIGSIRMTIFLLIISFHALSRLDSKIMYQVRKWERFQFMIDYEH
jgi:hypothetical protein